MDPKTLKRDEKQPRRSFNPDDLEELSASIKANGIINPPEVTEDGVIVTGERRIRAAQLAGMKSIPIKVVPNFTEGQLRVRQLAENMSRSDLTPYEVGLAVQHIIDEQKLTQKQIGNLLGKDQTTISLYLSTLSFDQKKHQKILTSPDLKFQMVKMLSRVKGAEKRGVLEEGTADEILTQISKKNFSTTDISILVMEAILHNPGAAKEYLSVKWKGLDWSKAYAAISRIAPTPLQQINKVNRAAANLAHMSSVLQRAMSVCIFSSLPPSKQKHIKEQLLALEKQIGSFLSK